MLVDRHTTISDTYLCKKCYTIKRRIKRNNKNKEEVKQMIGRCKICGCILDYTNNFKCTNNFCNKHSFKQFESLIKYFGFDESKLGTIYVEEEWKRIRDILNNLYWNEHKSSTEICEIFNYPNVSHLTHNIFNFLDIKIKTLTDAIRENIKYERLNMPSNHRYKAFHYTTWNGKTVYLRSSYEYDYAKILDDKHIDYTVESLRIEYFDTQENCIRIAIPDFYLCDTNTIVEVKSNWTLDK